jgi:hypothetical protein
LFDIGNDDRSSLGRCCPAYALTECDLEAAQGSLVWAHAEQTTRLDDTVEASPEMPKGVVDQTADRRHGCDVVIDVSEHRSDVGMELIVGGWLCDSAQVERDLGHSIGWPV